MGLHVMLHVKYINRNMEHILGKVLLLSSLTWQDELSLRFWNQTCFVYYSLTVYTSTHLNTPQHASTPSELWCTGTPVGGGGSQTERRRGENAVREIHITETGSREGREEAWSNGWKVGWEEEKWVVERGGDMRNEWGRSWRRAREDEGRQEEAEGGCFLSPFPPAHIDSPREREKENIWADCRPHDILSGSLAFPPWRVMCSLPPFPFPPPLPPFSCPSKLRHVISHHKNRGGKTRWRYRCLRVSGTKAACKYSRERRRSEETERERQKEGGKEEGGDRKLKRKTESTESEQDSVHYLGLVKPWASKRVCVWRGAVIKVDRLREMSSVYFLKWHCCNRTVCLLRLSVSHTAAADWTLWRKFEGKILWGGTSQSSCCVACPTIRTTKTHWYP